MSANDSTDQHAADRAPGRWVRMTTAGYVCEECGETVPSGSHAKRHLRERHGRGPPNEDAVEQRHRDREWLHRNLVERGRSALSVAARLDISHDAVLNAAREYGLEYDQSAKCWRVAAEQDAARSAE